MSTGGRRSRPLSDDERALWDAVTRSVARLKRRKAAAQKAHADAEARPVPQAEAPRTAEKPNGKAPKVAVPAAARPAPKTSPPPLAPLGRRMKQKLARGSESIDARIDLHGLTQSEAHYALARFLRSAQRDGARMVLVITGKGARADADVFSERGVLKRQVPLWLEGADLRALVVGFENAGIGHGGQGALYVRIRRARG